MPLGGGNGSASAKDGGRDRPVVFQKFFKSGNKTYASQVKVALNGRKYLVLTEGVRDPETQEVKKHYLRVFDQDMKEFFAMLQETVLYLRSAKDSPASIAATKVEETTAKPTPQAKPAKMDQRVAATPQPAMKAAPAARPAIVKPLPQTSPKNGKYTKVAPRSSGPARSTGR